MEIPLTEYIKTSKQMASIAIIIAVLIIFVVNYLTIDWIFSPTERIFFSSAIFSLFFCSIWLLLYYIKYLLITKPLINKLRIEIDKLWELFDVFSPNGKDWFEAKANIFKYLRDHKLSCGFLAIHCEQYGFNKIVNSPIFSLYDRDTHEERELMGNWCGAYPTPLELQQYGINAGKVFKAMWDNKNLLIELKKKAMKYNFP